MSLKALKMTSPLEFFIPHAYKTEFAFLNIPLNTLVYNSLLRNNIKKNISNKWKRQWLRERTTVLSCQIYLCLFSWLDKVIWILTAKDQPMQQMPTASSNGVHQNL